MSDTHGYSAWACASARRLRTKLPMALIALRTQQNFIDYVIPQSYQQHRAHVKQQMETIYTLQVSDAELSLLMLEM